MMRQTAGGSYQMYERWFTEALGPAIDKLDPVLRPQAITIASELGYIADTEVMAAGFGPGLCSISGIDEHFCHCGRRSEEHTSELQSLMRISYAVFCLKK